jgi:NAD(P)H-hydrate epimerase
LEFTLTRSQVRAIDQSAITDYHVPGIVLMENAGRGAAEVLMRLGVRGTVIILCGRGNNAGDGFVVARHLDRRSIAVRVICAGDPLAFGGDAQTNFKIAQASGIAIEQFTTAAQLAAELVRAEWIVDALLGTGASGSPRAPMDAMIDSANASTVSKMALDVPSGLDCDSGVAGEPTFVADHTCTFVAAKPGLLTQRAKHFVGQLHIVDIGAPRVLLESLGGDA